MMAMTKKEQQAMADLQQELRLAKAMRFTEDVRPDVAPPSGSGLTKGFLYNNYIGGHSGPHVEPACSGCVSHAFGQDDHTTTQDPKFLYSTRLLALRALRHSVEIQVATLLAGIDQQIEEELGD